MFVAVKREEITVIVSLHAVKMMLGREVSIENT